MERLISKVKFEEYCDFLDKHMTRIPNMLNPGAPYIDLYEVYEDPELRERAIAAATFALAENFKGKFTAIAGIEGRPGALLAITMSEIFGVPFIRVCQNRATPFETVTATLERSTGKIELQLIKKEVPKDTKVILFDDLIATGKTLGAVTDLFTKLGAHVAGYFCLCDVPRLIKKGQFPAPVVSLVSLKGLSDEAYKKSYEALAKEIVLVDDPKIKGKKFFSSYGLLHNVDSRDHLVDCLTFSALKKFGGAANAVIGVDKRGLYLSEVVARALSLPLITVTRTGDRDYVPKDKILSVDIKGEEETKKFVCKKDKVKKGDKVLIVADVLVTGKSLAAAEQLLKLGGAEIAGYLCVCVNSTGAPEKKLAHPDKFVSLFSHALTI